MFSIDTRSRIPIYEQLKDQILNLVRLGILVSDEQLPSIRGVAAQTGVNVNTVKRAFQELESEGIIYSVVGRGSFVSPNALDSTVSAKKALSEIEEQIRSIKLKGVTKQELSELIEKIYKEEE